MEILFPYQLEGAAFLAQRGKGAFLYDDMGLGKSAQAIRAADLVKADKILVICPAAARINWGREFKRFQKRARDTEVVLKSSQLISKGSGVTVVNYDLVNKPAIRNQLLSHKWDVLICDESHFLKEPKSKRTQAVLGPRWDGEHGIAGSAKRAWFLSGTPAPNNPLELWTTMRTVCPEAITYNGKPLSHWQFMMRYTVHRINAYKRVQILKGRNVEELKAKLAPYMIRRKKADVLKDLPPIRTSTIALDSGETLKHVLKMEQHHEVRALFELIKKAGPHANLESFKRVAITDSEHVATTVRMTGIMKAHATVELLKEELAGGLKKIVLMAWHREVIDILYQGLNAAGFKTVRLYGGMSAEDKQASIDSFQQDDSTRVFIGQIISAGTAITLTSSSDLMFVEASWSPEVNNQARDRVYRIGQKNPVLIRFAYLPGSIDEAITSVLERKMADINQLLN